MHFDPRLPDELQALGFRIQHRGQWLEVSVDADRLRLSTHPCQTAGPIRVTVGKERITLEGADAWEFAL